MSAVAENIQTEMPHPFVFTDSAAAKVADLIAEEGNPELKLRVFVQGGGCSGFQYGFTFDEITNEDDTTMTKNGVSLLIDAMSYQYLVGAEIDYKDDLEGAQFVIKNPNATSTCGCGSSFSTRILRTRCLAAHKKRARQGPFLFGVLAWRAGLKARRAVLCAKRPAPSGLWRRSLPPGCRAA